MAGTGLKRKTLVGSVLAGKMDKTATVVVERLTKHQRYGKYVKRHVKYKAHDEENRCRPGDKVSIVETRPISKTKCWRVKEILEKAK